ncbi:hypothetical protein FRZ67_16940 [Panacibacter ginsenosidivorans]|uniref:DUF1080 domain-containing protein n=1 Tax=Panacibacter ginsenosidivorans TaxID=1813871 RepID=A0A5B8VC60_9BACT|nr:hypothetical protein [Panacibacter ginsenosidivorans]QEC68912.1 hypothetical protein FRZ67_16940 [Panacibacter ginsenosidivorans]
MNKILVSALLCFSMNFSLHCLAQQKIISADLSDKSKLQTVNRTATLSKDAQGKPIIHLDAKPGDGVIWIKGLHFTKGTIEFDVKGKDLLQQSFVGIAFHGVNDSTFEGVYFRPFNFQAADPVRKKHAVQYISLPKYDWSYLRETYPDKYEHALLSVVDPNSWFHVKVIVENNSITAFVNADTEPCLSVQPLTHAPEGKIGFWVGNNSDGDFSNLVIKNMP